jgi:hypothetical protein
MMDFSTPTAKRPIPWVTVGLSLTLVLLLVLCIAGFILGWFSFGKCAKKECPAQKECPAPTECPAEKECPACPEAASECPECPVCPVGEAECPICPPVTPELEKVVDSKPAVVIQECKTSPGCPENSCMIWDGKRCRYPRGFTKPTTTITDPFHLLRLPRRRRRTKRRGKETKRATKRGTKRATSGVRSRSCCCDDRNYRDGTNSHCNSSQIHFHIISI